MKLEIKVPVILYIIGSQVSINCSQTTVFDCILSILVILSTQQGYLTWKLHDWWWCCGFNNASSNYCSRFYGGGERCAQGSGWETWGKETIGGDPDIDGRIILRQIFRKWEGVLGTGWSWLRIGTGGGHLWVRWWTFGFHKMWGISWLAAEPVSFWRRALLHGVSK